MVAPLPSDARRLRFERVFAEAYQPVQRYVLRRADRSIADDVVADTFLAVWRRLEDVPDEAVVPWCYGVARRTLANARRGDHRREALAQRLAAAPSADSDAAVDLDGDLEAAMATLAVDERELLRLWAWEDLMPHEIAVSLGITPNAVSIRLHRARAALRQHLQRKSGNGAGHETDGPRRTAASTEEDA